MNLNSQFIGKILDKRYKINKIIGVGGMSIVFEAYDAVAGHTVAVKVLKQEMANDEHAVRRFINESRTVSMLSHPNIVKIYDVSVKSQMKYIVMERIDGITLKSYMERKGILSVNEMLSYTEQILSALSYAHSMGVVHRDIKPQN
ncbi:MAG: serine/threonine protein kinase, partial [Clostridia bacterium]|nr:serine/threonine protein kinase [Clostridia bacterium]